jgi:group II intron reverse transcriptase/maturase
MVISTLSHHIDLDWMHEAFAMTRKDGATGIDGQTAAQYAEGLDEKLADLLERIKKGVYRAPAVRRTFIPKGDGVSLRPLGIPTFEDKVAQRAICMVLESVFEQDFLPCSYGFRPGRSAHQALDALRDALMEMKGGYVIELDVRQYFDRVDHGRLQDVLGQRISDGVIRRMVGKWLNAGVMENGAIRKAASGTPQGGVISPMLGNIYLHEVLDKWFERDVKPRLAKRAVLVRYADDAVIVCADKQDAERIYAVLFKRFAKYGLELHPQKTRCIEMRRPPFGSAGQTTFDFLGFTHYWGKTKRGGNVIKLKTAKDRLRRTLKRVREWIESNFHTPIAAQYAVLSRKLQGHYAYFGVCCNRFALEQVHEAVERMWMYWLNRRSRNRRSWRWFKSLKRRFQLPRPRLRPPRLSESTA